MPRTRLSPEVVVAAAAELADADGLGGFSATRLAEALGVAPSALYNHIDSVDALVGEVSVLATNELLDVLVRAAVGRTGAEALAAVAAAYRRFAVDHGGRYAATLVPTLADDDAQARLDREITEVLARVVTSFGRPEAGAYAEARSIRAALHGFVSLEATGGFPESDRIDESFDRLVALLASGLAAADP